MIVDVALYVDGVRTEGPSDISDLVDLAREREGFVWLGLASPTQAEFDLVVGELQFHPLAVEDAVTAKQRPKLEDYDGLTFFVIKTVFFDQAAQEITTGELMCFIDSHFIVTVRHGEGHPRLQRLDVRDADKDQGASVHDGGQGAQPGLVVMLRAIVGQHRVRKVAL